MDVEDRQLMCNPEVCVGRMGCLLFVTEGYVFNAVLITGVDQGVVGMSALSKYLFNSFLLQTRCYEHRSGHRYFTFFPTKDSAEPCPSAPT